MTRITWFKAAKSSIYHKADVRPTQVGEHYIARCGYVPGGYVDLMAGNPAKLHRCKRCQALTAGDDESRVAGEHPGHRE